ncbi:NADH-quinone oxidoreductase subunit C/D [Filimonas sp.]|nr:NADH-quinone oxidoreductase subunit C/D [Filimonas sp.]
MEKEVLQSSIAALLPSATFEEGGDWLNVLIEPTYWLALAKQLREQEALHFDYLFCLTCIDWKTHLTMVYHLSSTIYRHNIVVKAKLDKIKPEIETVSHIWRTAEFHEREVYEMFGVNFLHHPDLRLLILPDGWEGKNPLRKDFDDPVNMIKL